MNKKTNVLYILSDDQGAWAMHCAGNDDIKTPALDSLAKEGMRFESFFCTSPVCSPARASLLTGRIPSAHGVLDWIRSGNLNKDELGELKNLPQFASESKAIRYLDGMTAYTDILAQNGYNCALSGKWHMGDSMTPQHGFSRWFTIGRGGCTYYGADMIENRNIHIENRYITDVITDRALEFMDELAKEEKPFYLSVHYTAPHSPWDKDNHPAEYWDLYKDCEYTATPDLPIHKDQVMSAPYGTGEVRKELLNGYYAAVSAMDNQIARLIKRLEELSIRENTLIVFNGDNGMNMGHHGIWGKGNGTFPFNMYDTAVKVPLIFSHPSVIPQGTVAKGMYSQYDFMPTLLDYLDLPYTPDSDLLPGHSFAKTLKGDMNESEKSVFIYDEYGFTRMVRTNEWKYIHRYPYGEHELYHLSVDPDENINCIDNPCNAEIVKELRAQLFDWFTQYSRHDIDGAREPVTGFGQLCRPGIYSHGEETFEPMVK